MIRRADQVAAGDLISVDRLRDVVAGTVAAVDAWQGRIELTLTTGTVLRLDPDHPVVIR